MVSHVPRNRENRFVKNSLSRKTPHYLAYLLMKKKDVQSAQVTQETFEIYKMYGWLKQEFIHLTFAASQPYILKIEYYHFGAFFVHHCRSVCLSL